ncbi:MAG: hypothetical protein M3010_07260, partial [Candidatus Dormibacteraeota bacterium]|nr:hypothetical protein [Candidatus Dormibacteraeota bacterium]
MYGSRKLPRLIRSAGA